MQTHFRKGWVYVKVKAMICKVHESIFHSEWNIINTSNIKKCNFGLKYKAILNFMSTEKWGHVSVMPLLTTVHKWTRSWRFWKGLINNPGLFWCEIWTACQFGTQTFFGSPPVMEADNHLLIKYTRASLKKTVWLLNCLKAFSFIWITWCPWLPKGIHFFSPYSCFCSSPFFYFCF